MNIERFIERYSKEIEAGTAAIFAGAGLSCSAGYVNWAGLLRDIAEDLGLDVDRETDLISIAQFHVNRHGGNRGHLNQSILHEFPTETNPTVNHRLLSRLPISTWWTTNYDKLIERGIEAEGKIPDVKYDKNQLSHTKPRRDCVVYKMHGDIDHPGGAVITRDDYESYENERGMFVTALTGDLVSKTFLFLGFSFTDPNLNQVLARIRNKLKDNQRPHYAIFRNVSRSDFKSDGDFQYACRRQILVIEDLRRFNINVVLVESCKEIDNLISELYRRHSSRYVFVSSSASNFDPWGEAAVSRFMSKLGSLLTGRGFRLVTGLGLGTGNALMSGAILEIASNPAMKLDHDVLIRPFPQHFEDAAKRDEVWHAYREDMIGRAGISLFLFGNKEGGSGVILALGMKKEFDIAVSKGVAVLPVGATGSMAQLLLDEVRSSSSIHLSSGIRAQLEELGERVDDLDQLLGPILDVVEAVRVELGTHIALLDPTPKSA